MVCPPSRGSCLPLSPLVSPCLPSCFPLLDGLSAFPRSCLPLSPIVSPHVCLCWMVCPPSEGLVSPCLPWSPHICACVGWCVRLPEVLSPLSPSLSPSLSSFLSPILSPNLSFFLFPFVAGGLILHFCPNSVWLGVLNAFSCHVFDPVPQKHVLNPPTVWGLRLCNSLYVLIFLLVN